MMAKSKMPRLPPQPANTALARFVRRLIDRLPGATIGTWNGMQESIYRLQRRLYRADEDNQRLHGRVRQLETDFRRLMAPVPRPFGMSRGRIEDDPWRAAPVIRMSVTYEPMCFAMVISPQELDRAKAGSLSPHTHHALRKAARQIAQEQAEQHEAEILSATLKSLNIEGTANV